MRKLAVVLLIGVVALSAAVGVQAFASKGKHKTGDLAVERLQRGARRAQLACDGHVLGDRTIRRRRSRTR